MHRSRLLLELLLCSQFLENNRPTGHQYSIVLIRHRTVLSRHAVMDATVASLELADNSFHSDLPDDVKAPILSFEESCRLVCCDLAAFWAGTAIRHSRNMISLMDSSSRNKICSEVPGDDCRNNQPTSPNESIPSPV